MKITLREKVLKDNSKSYYLDIYINGKRTYEFLNIRVHPQDSQVLKKEKITAANLLRSQREIEIISSNTNYIPRHKRRVNFLSFYASYIEAYQKRDHRMIRHSFNKFLDFLRYKKLLNKQLILQVENVTPSLCEDFRDYLISDLAGLSGETPQNYFHRFKKVLKYATKEGLFYKNPAEGVVFKKSDLKSNLRKQILTAEELVLLSRTTCGNEELKRAFLFACHTGLGFAEIKKLKGSNIKNDRLIITRQKTNVVVNIKLSKSALALLGIKKKNEELIFDLNISETAVNKNLNRWMQKAKIDKHITFYCARHSYAVLLLKNGANLKSVSEAMGQTSTTHTIKYLNFVDSLKDEATSNLPDIF